MGLEMYIAARKEALREVRSRSANGTDPYLLVLEDLLPNFNSLPRASLGIQEIDLRLIAGTVTAGRTSAFTAGFLPLLETDSEFASKWSVLYDSALKSGINEPIKVFEYYGAYYVLEGNKRVSVSGRLNAMSIEADVTRLIPEKEDSDRWEAYQGYLQFFEDTRINFIRLERPGAYAKLCELLGHKPGVHWTEEEIQNFRSDFYRFRECCDKILRNRFPLSCSEIYVNCLRFFGCREMHEADQSALSRILQQVQPMLKIAAMNKPTALLDTPIQKKPNLLNSVLGSTSRRIVCAFLFDTSPEISGWAYWHDLGRRYLEREFGDRIEIRTHYSAAVQEADGIIDAWAAEGVEVVFAISPVFAEVCLRQALRHPALRILTCSLRGSLQNVRSYYLRFFEAKFLLGVVAGAMTQNDLIGYIADYPILGTPASINAFALGTQITNPRAKILLDWSTLPGHEPEAFLREKDVRLISGRDILAMHPESPSFGLYCIQNDSPKNLAMPIWNWGKLYTELIHGILSGGWALEEKQIHDRALNYFPGISSGTIDIMLSDEIPNGIRKLIDTLRKDMIHGTLLAFDGPLIDQNGTLRLRRGEALTLSDIASMDFLMENITGKLPEPEELTSAAHRLADICGIHVSQEVLL